MDLENSPVMVMEAFLAKRKDHEYPIPDDLLDWEIDISKNGASGSNAPEASVEYWRYLWE
jgi:hypothetical protein